MSNKLPTLFKRDSKGKIREWTIEIEGDKHRAIAGLQDGKKVISKWTVAEPKNIGKSNETTGEEQAKLEAEAIWRKKTEKDYHENLAKVDEAIIYKPMLAHKWVDHGHKMPNIIRLSPKMDGVRVIVTKSGCFSRGGKHYPALEGLRQKLLGFFEVYPDGILDGEAYNHTFHNKFSDLVRFAKKTKKEEVAKVIDEVTEKLKIIIFDVPRIGDLNEDISFIDRWKKFQQERVSLGIPNDWVIDYELCRKDLVEEKTLKLVEQGYEGSMIRDENGKYEQKKSYKLQKYKLFDDDEFEIVDFEEGSGNASGKAARVICLLPDGTTFEAGLCGNEELFKEYLNNKHKYIGKMANIRYQGYTDTNNKPRFAKMHSIRDYE